MTDFTLQFSEEELTVLTEMLNDTKPKIPLTITYDNIVVKQWTTATDKNPLPLFRPAMENARRHINAIMGECSRTADSWTIQNGFMTITATLHCCTEYDCSEDVFEDKATHRVAISVKAQYDTKCVYSHDKYATEVFAKTNKLYASLLSGPQR
jgi:hypothetical protein